MAINYGRLLGAVGVIGAKDLHRKDSRNGRTLGDILCTQCDQYGYLRNHSLRLAEMSTQEREERAMGTAGSEALHKEVGGLGASVYRQTRDLLAAKLRCFLFMKLACATCRKWHTAAHTQGEVASVVAANLSNMLEPLLVKEYTTEERAGQELARSAAATREKAHQEQEKKRRATIAKQRGIFWQASEETDARKQCREIRRKVRNLRSFARAYRLRRIATTAAAERCRKRRRKASKDTPAPPKKRGGALAPFVAPQCAGKKDESNQSRQQQKPAHTASKADTKTTTAAKAMKVVSLATIRARKREQAAARQRKRRQALAAQKTSKKKGKAGAEQGATAVEGKTALQLEQQAARAKRYRENLKAKRARGEAAAPDTTTPKTEADPAGGMQNDPQPKRATKKTIKGAGSKNKAPKRSK
eukprot:g16966.t1